MIPCPGCTSHGDCDVAEIMGLIPGQHFWTNFIEEDKDPDDQCDLCGITRREAYP